MKLCANANSIVSRQAFLHFILSHYVTERVRDLSREKLLPLLRLKYREAISNAVAELGKPEEIGILFAGFQNFLQRQEGRKAGCTRRADGALNPVAESSNWLYDRN